MKIAIFGGSFNPIHIGHLIIANYAIINGGMDKVIFVPSGNHPFKNNKIMVNGELRFTMIEESIKNDNKFDVSNIELLRKDTTYTYDTILSLKKIYPNDDLFFLIGYDIILELEKWMKIKELSEICTFLVMKRQIEDESKFKAKVKFLQENYNSKFIFADSPYITVSSSEIRDLISKGKRINYLIPDGARKIITEKGLYNE